MKSTVNLVLVTSCINAPSGLSVFSREERINQLVFSTIPSIRKKIPNPYIAILEGSSLLSSKETEILESSADEVLFWNVSGYEKSLGEIILITTYFKYRDPHKFDSIVKISGRYQLTDSFDFNNHKGTVIKVRYDEHSGEYLCETRYYKVVKENFDQYISGLQRIVSDGLYGDIEHTFHKYNIVPCNEMIDKIGICGYLAPNGQYVED